MSTRVANVLIVNERKVRDSLGSLFISSESPIVEVEMLIEQIDDAIKMRGINEVSFNSSQLNLKKNARIKCVHIIPQMIRRLMFIQKGAFIFELSFS